MSAQLIDVPSKISYRLNDFIECKINEIIELSRTTKTQTLRSIFNLGLNSFFKDGKAKPFDSDEWSNLINWSQLHKIKYPLSEPQNCKITKMQESDFEKIGLIGLVGKGHAIRLVFHLGINDFNDKFNSEIRAIKNSKDDGMSTMTDRFNIARNIVHSNYFDKV